MIEIFAFEDAVFRDLMTADRSGYRNGVRQYIDDPPWKYRFLASKIEIRHKIIEFIESIGILNHEPCNFQIR